MCTALADRTQKKSFFYEQIPPFRIEKRTWLNVLLMQKTYQKQTFFPAKLRHFQRTSVQISLHPTQTLPLTRRYTTSLPPPPRLAPAPPSITFSSLSHLPHPNPPHTPTHTHTNSLSRPLVSPSSFPKLGGDQPENGCISPGLRRKSADKWLRFYPVQTPLAHSCVYLIRRVIRKVPTRRA